MLVLLGVLFGFVVSVAVMAAGIITIVVGIGMVARAIGAIIDFFRGDDAEEVEVEAPASDDVIDAEEDDEEESEDEDEESEDEDDEEEK